MGPWAHDPWALYLGPVPMGPLFGPRAHGPFIWGCLGPINSRYSGHGRPDIRADTLSYGHIHRGQVPANVGKGLGLLWDVFGIALGLVLG